VATTVLPALIDAIITTARTALPNVDVYDGFGVTSDPAEDVLLVGVDDPDAATDSFAGYARQEWAHANYTARDEEGHVVCAASSWRGSGDAKAARDGAFATVAAVENALRTNSSLGLANVLWTSVGGRIALSQNQHDNGATAVVIFTIQFRSRI
jgi:hypothetical protein